MNLYESELLEKSASCIEGLEKRASIAEARVSELDNKLDHIKIAMSFVELGRSLPYSDFGSLEKDASILSDSDVDLSVLNKAIEIGRTRTPSLGKVARRSAQGSAGDTPEARWQNKLEEIFN